jgi:hypothetical protein
MYDMISQPNDGDRSPTLTISAPNVLSPGCGCEPAYFRQVDGNSDHAACNICGQDVTVSIDIARHLDSGEHLVWINGTDGEGFDRGLVLAYFVEEIEGVEDDD